MHVCLPRAGVRCCCARTHAPCLCTMHLSERANGLASSVQRGSHPSMQLIHKTGPLSKAPALTPVRSHELSLRQSRSSAAAEPFLCKDGARGLRKCCACVWSWCHRLRARGLQRDVSLGGDVRLQRGLPLCGCRGVLPWLQGGIGDQVCSGMRWRMAHAAGDVAAGAHMIL